MSTADSDRRVPLPISIADIVEFLETLAPLELAEEWDNVGLLWGDSTAKTARVMTCLTLTPDVAAEAVRRGAGLLVTHHPILFRPVQRLTSQTTEGRMLLSLAKNGIAVYSAHTAYDNARDGINGYLADLLRLEAVAPLRAGSPPSFSPTPPQPQPGSGRFGSLAPPCSLSELLEHVKRGLGVERIQFVGERGTRVERLAIACGAAADFLDDAIRNGCQALLTGEARFHACAEARERGMALVLIGHFASERPAMQQLAEQIGRRFPSIDVWSSAVETDPIQWA